VSPTDTPGDEDVLQALRAAFDDARAEVASVEDLRAAFALASKLVTGLQSMTDDAAELRHRLAARIYDAEATSLQVLADDIGMSKSQFDRLAKKGRAAAAREGTPPCAD
jgi:DnaJ-domain-containing protein 1